MARRKRRKKWGTVTCSICKKKIAYKVLPKYIIRDGADPNRLVYIRKHWARKHPRAWKKAIQRGVRKRRRKRGKRLRKR